MQGYLKQIKINGGTEMLITDESGKTRIAYKEDFKDVQITFTPQEWADLVDFFEYRKKYSPSTFKKTTPKIYKKLIENEPKLKDGLREVKQC